MQKDLCWQRFSFRSFFFPQAGDISPLPWRLQHVNVWFRNPIQWAGQSSLAFMGNPVLWSYQSNMKGCAAIFAPQLILSVKLEWKLVAINCRRNEDQIVEDKNTVKVKVCSICRLVGDFSPQSVWSFQSWLKPMLLHCSIDVLIYMLYHIIDEQETKFLIKVYWTFIAHIWRWWTTHSLV